MLFEYTLTDGTRSDFVPSDHAGHPMAALEAKHAGIDPVAAQEQGRHYAAQLEVPFASCRTERRCGFLIARPTPHP